MKLDEFEMRDYPNERMINHFKKMIGVTKKRIGVAKGRYDGLMKEYNGLVGTSERKEDESKRVVRKEDGLSVGDLSGSSYLDALESDDDDDDDDEEGIDDSDCAIELSFNASSSTTSRVDRQLQKSGSCSSLDEHTQVTTDI